MGDRAQWPTAISRVCISRDPVILAVIARHTATGTLAGARQGYVVERSELGEAVPPLAVDSAFGAFREEVHRLATAVKGIEAVHRALRGEPL